MVVAAAVSSQTAGGTRQEEHSERRVAPAVVTVEQAEETVGERVDRTVAASWSPCWKKVRASTAAAVTTVRDGALLIQTKLVSR